MTVRTLEETHVLSKAFVLFMKFRILQPWVKRLDTLTAERDFDDGNEIPLSTAVNVVRQVQFIIGQLRGFVEQNG